MHQNDRRYRNRDKNNRNHNDNRHRDPAGNSRIPIHKERNGDDQEKDGHDRPDQDNKGRTGYRHAGPTHKHDLRNGTACSARRDESQKVIA